MTALLTTVPQPVRAMPQVKGWPVVGSLPELRRDTLGFLASAWQTHGDLFQCKIGSRPLTVVSDPVLARRILVEENQLFQRRRTYEGATPLAMILGHSSLTIDGISWLSKRRTIQPVFHHRRIQAMGDLMVQAGERMLDRWQAKPSAVIDLHEEMKVVTMDIISRTMFGADVLGQLDQIGDVVDIGVQYINGRTMSVLPIPPHWPTPANRRFQAAKRKLDDFIYPLIRQRRAAMRAGEEGPGDLLQMLLMAQDAETGAYMDDEAVRNEVATIYGAGHETTALALTWAWYALNQEPSVMHKLQEEVDHVLAGRLPTLADLPNLPYTLQVLEETLRLFPPLPYTTRAPIAETTLGGQPLAAGSLILINIYNIHRHPKYWILPESFWPERVGYHRQFGKWTAYMPFLTGPHQCVGSHFAMMEGQLLLAMMAQRYTLELLPGQRIEKQAAITLRPRYGMQMRLQPR